MDKLKTDDSLNCKYRSQFEQNGYYDPNIWAINAGGPGTYVLKKLPPLFQKAMHHRMEEELASDSQMFQYGVEEGNCSYLDNLVKFLSEEYNDEVKRENLCMNGGASSGLWMLLTAVVKPKPIVFVQDPTYFIALLVFQKFDATIVPVKTDADGLDVEDLEKQFDHYKPQFDMGLLYLISVFHNPSGATLPPEKCNKVVKLARKFNILVVCDDVYNLLYYNCTATEAKRLFHYDKQTDPDYKGNVISNGTFSKFVGPGLRLGWLEAPNWVIKELKESPLLESGGGVSSFMGDMVGTMMQLGLIQEHLSEVRIQYKAAMNSAIETFKNNLPKGCEITENNCKGGYFIWIKLPERIDATELRNFATSEYKVLFAVGAAFSPSGSFKNYMRVAISFYPRDHLVAGIEKLCQAIKKFMDQKQIPG